MAERLPCPCAQWLVRFESTTSSALLYDRRWAPVLDIVLYEPVPVVSRVSVVSRVEQLLGTARDVFTGTMALFEMSMGYSRCSYVIQRFNEDLSISPFDRQ